MQYLNKTAINSMRKLVGMLALLLVYLLFVACFNDDGPLLNGICKCVSI